MNLKEQSSYRVYKAPDYMATPINERPWALELRGKYGSIYKHSASLGTAWVKSSTIANRINRMKWLALHQDCRPTEATFLFKWSDLDRIADIIQCKKRRRASPNQLANLEKSPLRYRQKALKQAKTSKLCKGKGKA